MKTIAMVFLLSISSVAFAQNPGIKELRTKVIGWDKTMYSNGNMGYKDQAARNINNSPVRKKWIDTFCGWIRQSYVPFGVLPQPSMNIYPEKATTIEPIPLTSGVSMQLWAPCYTADRKGITRAQPASATVISIYANSIPGMEPGSWFNTTSQFYFTMDITPDGKCIDAESQQKFEPIINEVRSKIGGDYLIYVTGKRYINVVLMPGKKLPLQPVSRSEALSVAEAGAKKANGEGKNPTDRMQLQIKTIAEMRQKYRDSLAEPAQINDMQYRIYTFDSPDDPFQGKKLYPLYKFNPETYRLCKTDRPQWITISFEIPQREELATKKIWDAMTENFNYEYVYNYFFDPQKVKGKSYQPRHAP